MHWVYFLFIVMMIVALCFTTKEGMFGNSDITSANSEITKLKSQIKGLQASLKGIYEYKFTTLGVISQLTPILESSDPPKYTLGIVSEVKKRIQDFSNFQKEFEILNDELKKIKKEEKLKINDKYYTLEKGLDYLLEKLEKLEDQLSDLPDS